MKKATQEQIDAFMQSAMEDPKIHPYLTVKRYYGNLQASKDDWEGIDLISADQTTYLSVTFDRSRDLEMSIGLWSKTPFGAGLAVYAIKDIVKRYRPRAINASVHSSNKRSMALNTRLLGDPCGVKKLYAWNMSTGSYEDLYSFRLLIEPGCGEVYPFNKFRDKPFKYPEIPVDQPQLTK